VSTELPPRLADAKRALDAADRVMADGQTIIAEGHEMIKQGKERQLAAEPQYWTAAKLIFGELSDSTLTQQDVAELLGRPRSQVSKLYSVGKTFRTRDPIAEGLSFTAAYKQAQEVSDYGIGREKILGALDDAALTQGEVEERTGLAHSTVSETLKKLIQDGTVQKGAGRPARYERAVVSPVREEQPTNDQPGNDGPGDSGQPEEESEADREQRGQDQPGPDDRPQLEDTEGRRSQDAEEIIRFVERRIRREITGKRLTLTPAEARRLIDEMTGTISALRDRFEITMVRPDQKPDANAVGEGLAKLGKELRWANTTGQQTYYTDGGTVWVVIANTRAAIVRQTGSKITLHPSDVTAGWLITKATGSTR
jgi:predicted XRE-type DNA-binding protein